MRNRFMGLVLALTTGIAVAVMGGGPARAQVPPTPVPTPTPPRSAPAAPTISYVALGDSYSAGVGAGAYYGSSAYVDGTRGECVRSAVAYPLAVQSRQNVTLGSAGLFSGPPGFVACLGATVPTVRAQLGSLTDQTSLVTLSVGGNDIEFGPILEGCVSPVVARIVDDFETQLARIPAIARDSVAPSIAAAIAARVRFDPGYDRYQSDCTGDLEAPTNLKIRLLRPALDSLYAEISGRSPNATVVVLGYPKLFPDPSTSRCAFFSPEDQTVINRIQGTLNNTIRAAAMASGFLFADPTAEFDDHPICPWWNQYVNGLEFRAPTLAEVFGPNPLDPSKYAKPYSFHPNERGQSAFARVINDALADRPLTPARPTNLRATALDSSQVRLDWDDNSNNETGFVVRRAGSDVDTVGANVRTHTVTGLEPGREACFTVSAFNGAGRSTPSDEACATTSGATGALGGRVTNAATGANVAGATVRLVGAAGAQPCANSTVVATATSDANGLYRFTSVAAATYDVKTAAAGFSDGCTDNLAVPAAQSSVHNINLSPTLPPGSLRIILTWGANPRDLDSHLWTSSPPRYHVYYQDKGSLTTCPFAQLDRDAVSGFGPETITVLSLFPTGSYRYAVRDFRGTGSLPSSGARVQVFNSSGLLVEYQVPAGTGNWWHVFDLDGATGRLDTVNRIVTTEPAPYPDTTSGCGGTATALAGASDDKATATPLPVAAAAPVVAVAAAVPAAVAVAERAGVAAVAAPEPMPVDRQEEPKPNVAAVAEPTPEAVAVEAAPPPSDRAAVRAAEVAQRAAERAEERSQRAVQRDRDRADAA